MSGIFSYHKNTGVKYNTFYIQDFLAAICTELSVEFIQFRKRTGCFYEVYFSFSGTDNYWDVFFLNQVFDNAGVDLKVGCNVISVTTTGVLGVPGVLLLYGIEGCQFL